jgi:hypothetical protein
MEQLGKLVQLESLHTLDCRWQYHGGEASFDALSNLQSLHTPICMGNSLNFDRHLARIPMKNLQILESSDWSVIEALFKTNPPVQLKKLYLTASGYLDYHDFSLLWNYLTRVTSLTHFSLPHLNCRRHGMVPPRTSPFPELQYLNVDVAFAPHFADQPMKKMKININANRRLGLAEEVRQHWQGVVFPHVEYLEVDRPYEEINEIPIEFWREFLLNVNEVGCSD